MANVELLRIHRLKLTIVAIIAFILGIALLILARIARSDPALSWLVFWPLEEVGQTMVTAGIFTLVWEYFDAKDKEARDSERIRRLLKESTPDFRDAVVRGFAVENDDLKRVANPELLDGLARNALALRLGDQAFAHEIYAGLLAQAISTPERWHNVKVNLRLSCIQERTGYASPLSSFPVPIFEVVVTREYTFVPHQRVQRFACTSDRGEFHELLSEAPGTSVWFLTPRPGINAADKACFELVQYAVDGKDRPIRRSQRKTGQSYSVDLGEDTVREGKAITVRHVYKTVTAKDGHGLSIATSVPIRGMSVELDYTDTDIATLRARDLAPASAQVRRFKSEPNLSSKTVSVEVVGWLLPQNQISFVWTLNDEVRGSAAPDAASKLAAQPSGQGASRHRS